MVWPCSDGEGNSDRINTTNCSNEVVSKFSICSREVIQVGSYLTGLAMTSASADEWAELTKQLLHITDKNTILAAPMITTP